MSVVVVDDHLLRDILTGERPADLGGLASGIATTGLWLFRLSSAWASPERVGRLTAPVASLPAAAKARFLDRLMTLPAEIEVLHLRDMAWQMARLQHRHRQGGRTLSAAMVEALAAAHELDATVAVSAIDVAPNLRAAALHDGIAFHTL